MQTIYQYDERKAYTGQSREIAPNAGAPLGWTRLEPPATQAGEWAVFSGQNGWQVVTTEPEYPLPPVPESVSARQAKEALIRQGLYQAALDAIAAIADPTEKLLAQNYWEQSYRFERSNTTLIALATAGLGLTESQLDDLFRYAETL